jgi:hypothetical protein
MSEYIGFSSGKDIRKWLESYPIQPGSLEIQDFYELAKEGENHITAQIPPEGTDWYMIEHDIYTPKGSPLLAVSIAIPAANAEEALTKYVSGCFELQSNTDLGYVSVMPKDEFKYELQMLEVYRLK